MLTRARSRPAKATDTKATAQPLPRAQPNPSSLSAGAALANIPVLILFYVLLILPFMGGDGSPRMENILFWPTMAGIVLVLALYNNKLIDTAAIRSPTIVTLLIYLTFAGASITWAFAPDFSFSRYVLQLLAVTIILVPYLLPIDTSRTIQRLHACFVIAVGVNAYYVWATPGTLIGHTGYFVHKQELGMFCGAAIIMSLHELLFRGWRRWLAALSIALTVWVIYESQSKGSLAFLLVAPVFSAIALLLCRFLKTSPAYIVGGVVAGFAILDRFWSDPVARIAWYLYGDPTLTGRTYIWDFINYIVSQRSWFGWGFHSYWGVPNSPHNQAPGFVKDMVSTHNGYLELRLDTGTIGYWLFLAFIYTSLHIIEPVRRKDPVRAWLFLTVGSYILLLNMIESTWMNMGPLWIMYLIVVGECIRSSRAETVPHVVSSSPDLAKDRIHPLRRKAPARRNAA